MISRGFLRRFGFMEPSHASAVEVLAESSPAGCLRGCGVVGPSGELLGTVTLVVRRSDGARLAVVQRRRPSPRRSVLNLAGSTFDRAGFLHVSSDADVALIRA